MHQPSFMSDKSDLFRSFFGSDAVIDRDFKVRNHVDLHLGVTFSSNDTHVDLSDGQLTRVRPHLLRKFRYRDTQAAMGLWLYQIQKATTRTIRFQDIEFEHFPIAFRFRPDQPTDIPDLFADL